MIAFCTNCWAEMSAVHNQCQLCGACTSADTRSYAEKLVAALSHPMPEVRTRVCWLIGKNEVREAERGTKRCRPLCAQSGIRGIGGMKGARAVSLLEAIRHGSNRFLVKAVTK